MRGYIAASYEHMLEMERVRLTKAGKSPGDVNSAMKAFAEFYDLYLIRGMTPGDIIAQHREWKPLWYDAPDGQYGRLAAFHQQLPALNLRVCDFIDFWPFLRPLSLFLSASARERD